MSSLTSAGSSTLQTEGKTTTPQSQDLLESQSEELKEIFIGAVDAGTTSSRFIIFNGLGEPVAQHQLEFAQGHPQSG
jgi:glycerol kinase